MNNLKQKAKEIFGLNKDPEITEVDIGRNTALTRYIKANFLYAFQSSQYKIDSRFKLKKEKEGYKFEGVIIYHDTKPKVLYFDQSISSAHISKVFSKMGLGEETDWNIPADDYKNLALHAENYFLSANPEKSTNHFEKSLVEIVNEKGFHTRPAASFVKLANNYGSAIYIRNGKDNDLGNIEIEGKKYIDGKSIMSIMSLAAGKGSFVEILAKGPDAKDALGSLKNMITSGFGED